MADQIIHPVLPVTRTQDALKKKKAQKKIPVKPVKDNKKPDDKDGHIDTYA